MRKNEIRSEVQVIKAMIITYNVFDYNYENFKETREGIIKEIINKSCNLFEASFKWMKKYNRSTVKAFELECLWNELMDARFYGKVGYENITKIENGIRYIESGIFNKEV